MTDQDNSYRPQSPDLSSFQSSFPPPSNAPSYPFASPLAHRASYDASPFFAPQYHQQRPASQQYIPPFPNPGFDHDPDMARRSSRIARAVEAEPESEPKYAEEPSEPEASEEAAEPDEPEPEPKLEPELEEPVPEPKARPGEGIEVKTKFPVARIKRIMQADEDVGKVAQVTPIAVCTFFTHFPLTLDIQLTITRVNSQGIGTLHDHPSHQVRQRSQRPEFQTRHCFSFETRSGQR